MTIKYVEEEGLPNWRATKEIRKITLCKNEKRLDKKLKGK